MPKLDDKLPTVLISDEIRNFVARYGDERPRRAVFSTFDFDQGVFCRTLQPLLAKRRFGIMVLGDASRLQNRSEHPTIEGCEVQPVRCVGRGVFHPKVLFVRAGDHCLAGVGSSNLTRGGMGASMEFMHLSCEGDVVAGVAGFLRRLAYAKGVDLPISARRFIDRIVEGFRLPAGQSTVLDSLEHPLLSQMDDEWRIHCSGRPEMVAIISPWHSGGGLEEDGDPLILQRIKTIFRPTTSVCLYTDRVKGKPPRLPGTRVFVPKPSMADSAAHDEPTGEESSAQDVPRSVRPVHAKAYFLNNRRHRMLFFGSANCTQPALIRPVAAGNGNVEVLIANRNLTKCGEKRFLGDLARVFTEAPADECAPVKATKIRIVGHGQILCGEFIKGGRQLRIEAPRFSGTVRIAGRRGDSGVAVSIRRGVGCCSEKQTKEMLERLQCDSRSDSAWTAFLYERGRNIWPFPVSLPVFRDPEALDACDALDLWLAEEKGIRLSILQGRVSYERKVSELDALCEDEKNDPILDSLTECRHQGRLDRLAVRLTALVRCLLSLNKNSIYVSSRLMCFRHDIKKLSWAEDGFEPLPSHIQKAMTAYIDQALKRAKS